MHIIKGRKIVISENPKLHLVWYHSVIYLKPIPPYLLNHRFWTIFLCDSAYNSSNNILDTQTQSIKYQTGTEKEEWDGFDPKVALGYLRSYSLLIKHRSDLVIAIENNTIPENVDWLRWCRFIARFRDLRDDQVAMRYHFGQFRLTSLNMAVRLSRPKCSRSIGIIMRCTGKPAHT